MHMQVHGAGDGSLQCSKSWATCDAAPYKEFQYDAFEAISASELAATARRYCVATSDTFGSYIGENDFYVEVANMVS